MGVKRTECERYPRKRDVSRQMSLGQIGDDRRETVERVGATIDGRPLAYRRGGRTHHDDRALPERQRLCWFP
jgi:hypothetical protein